MSIFCSFVHVERNGWKGQQEHERAPTKPFDKPDYEPMANADLYIGQLLWVSIEGEGLPSDTAVEFSSNHPDEPGPSGENWNSIGHHSFYVVFQRTQGQTGATSSKEPVTTTPVMGFDNATYVSDTIPDGQVVSAGSSFTQTWRIRNTGNTTWQSGYVLAHMDILPAGSPAERVPLPVTQPGEEASISVTFTAPPHRGRYRSSWKPCNAADQLFGDLIWVEVEVVNE